MNGVPLNIDFQQILLHLLNVAILFAILYFLLYKPVKNFIDKRKQEYKDIDDATNSKMKEAEDLKEAYDAKLKQADDEIKTMKSEAAKAMNDRAIASEQKAKEESAQIIARAKSQAESEKRMIIEQAHDQVTDIASEAARKVLFKDSSAAFDSFLKTVEDEEKDGN